MTSFTAYKANPKDDQLLIFFTPASSTSIVGVVVVGPDPFTPSSFVFTSEPSVCLSVCHDVGEKRALTREQKLPSVRTHRGVFRRRCATRLLHGYGSVVTTRARVVVVVDGMDGCLWIDGLKTIALRTNEREARTRWTDDDD